MPSRRRFADLLGLARWLGPSLLGLLLATPMARANGAFPDASQVLLPADRPGTIILATNFGLVLSEDGGTNWRWTCEHDGSTQGRLYQLAAAPSPRIFTLGQEVPAHSDDLGCTWTEATGADGLLTADYFADPIAPDHLIALGPRAGDGGLAVVLVESSDGGVTLGRTLYTAPPDSVLTTAEIARSDPRIIYATLAPVGAVGNPRVIRSADGGASWQTREPAVSGRDELRLAAVDPTNPDILYLRVVPARGVDKFALSTDGGQSASLALTSGGQLTAFVKMADGTVLLGALEQGIGHLYRSTDGGHSFAPTAATIHPRGLAERAGQLYAATDNAMDGGALAVSGDRGDSWRVIMRLGDITSIPSCGDLPQLCAASCSTVASLGVIMPAVCAAGAPDASGGDGPATTEGPAPSGGGGCTMSHGPASGGVVGGLALVSLVAARARRRRFSRLRRAGRAES